MHGPNSDGFLDLLSGKLVSELHSELQQRLIDDPHSEANRHNLRLLEADLGLCSNEFIESTEHPSYRIAIVSLLFNWPSTGGGNVHTAELAKFLTLAGYEVCHFYAEYPPWRIGEVSESLDYRLKAIKFSDAEWSARSIRHRFQSGSLQWPSIGPPASMYLSVPSALKAGRVASAA